MPILEVVLKQLKYHGFTDIVLAVNHLAELLMAFFGDGSKLGLNIIYSIEDKPLGTAGPLKLVPHLEDNFLVMNGDLLTTINYRDFTDFHIKNNSIVSIATYRKEVKIDLGVLKMEGNTFQDYIEKPIYNFDVSTGVYAFNKKVLEYFPDHTDYFDIPNLILKLNDNNQTVKCFRDNYYWLDIGRVEDYETAVSIFEDRKNEFLY